MKKTKKKVLEILQKLKLSSLIISQILKGGDNMMITFLALNVVDGLNTLDDFKNKKLLNNPDIISRGFVNINESMELFGACKGVVKDTVLNILSDEEVGVYQIRHQIVEKLGEFLEQEIGRKPVILPTILEV